MKLKIPKFMSKQHENDLLNIYFVKKIKIHALLILEI